MAVEEDTIDLLAISYSTSGSNASIPVPEITSEVDFWESLSDASTIKDDTLDEKEMIMEYGINMAFDELITEDDQVPKDFSIEHLNYYTKEFKISIAIGGFGEVFKGWVVETNGDIVQKLAVKKSHDSSTGTMKQWQNEKDYLSTIHHPNIIKLIGHASNGRFYLVYEYMEHGSVSRSLRGLNWNQTKNIAIGSALAMQELHEKNLICRDFKSANILLDENYNPKLSDFGIVARENEPAKSGTRGSTDPTALREGHSTKNRDVYSMGILLLQLITKRVKMPWRITESVLSKFEGENLSIVHTDLKDSGCTEEDDRRITTLALRCLDEDITRRPTIQEVVDELGQLNGN